MQERYLTLYRCTFAYMSNAERFVFAYIELFSRSGKECGASQQYIAERLHISERTTRNSVKRLAECGFIFVRRSGKRKERNAYTVNRAQLHEILTAWKQENKQRAHSMPDVIRIHDSILAAFGASTKCLLVANLHQLQAAGKTKGGQLSAGVQYSQQELAEQCGCSRRDIMYALNDLESAGVISSGISNMQWKKARKYYHITGDIPQSCGSKPAADTEPQLDETAEEWDCEKPF